MDRPAFKFHSLFVPFPIALLLGALAADLAFWGTRDPLCAEAASWLSLAALTAMLASLAAGLLDGAWSHVCASAAAALVLVIGVLSRDAAPMPVSAALVLGAFAAAILLVSGASAAGRTAMQKASRRTLSFRLAGR